MQGHFWDLFLAQFVMLFHMVAQGCFFNTFEKTQGEKNLNVSAFFRKLKGNFFKNLKIVGFLSTLYFFSNNI